MNQVPGTSINRKCAQPMKTLPDGVIHCDFCRKGFCEIKCPFCYKGALLEVAVNQKNSCLI